MLETAVAPVPEQLEGDSNEVWIEALPARVYRTPQYGEISVDVPKLQRMITNFHQNVRGQEVATDWDHGFDPAKGRGASGWYRDFDIRPSSSDPNQMSLYAKVEFTDEAKQDIKNKKYKYWSLEWDDEYETDNGAIVPDVVIGGGLTNRPVAKRTMPINFSEDMWNDLSDEDKKYAAVLVKQHKLLSEPSAMEAFEKLAAMGFQIRLSEAAMEHSDPGIGAPLYASAQNQPDPGTGQPVPRVVGDPAADDPAIRTQSRRDPLPNTSDIEGDEPEVRQPSGRELQTGVIVPGSQNFSEVADLTTGQPRRFADDTKYLQTASRALVAFLNEENIEKDAQDVQECQAILGRIKVLMGKESQEPADMSSTAKAASELIQRIITKGGKTVKFTEAQINELKGLGLEVPAEDDADASPLVDTLKTAFSELSEFKKNVSGASKEREFAEMFPQQYKEHQALLDSNRNNAAVRFAEDNNRINRTVGAGDDVKMEPTRNGLSGLALNTIAEKHKKFAEGSGTLEDFEEAVKTIVNGGVVEFGEVGSSHEGDEPVVVDPTTAQGRLAARKLFAEKVAEVQIKHAKDNDGDALSVIDATRKASELYPELAKAYAATA